MELVIDRKLKNGGLVPWSEGAVVREATGFVSLCGNTATADNPAPSEVIGAAAPAQPGLVVAVVAVAALPD
jgi:hypothetical protein